MRQWICPFCNVLRRACLLDRVRFFVLPCCLPAAPARGLFTDFAFEKTTQHIFIEGLENKRGAAAVAMRRRQLH